MIIQVITITFWTAINEKMYSTHILIQLILTGTVYDVLVP